MQFSTLSLTAALAVLTAAAPQLAVRQPPIPIGEVELWSSAGCNPPGAPQLSTLPLFFESCVQFSPAPTSLEVTTLETTCIGMFVFFPSPQNEGLKRELTRMIKLPFIKPQTALLGARTPL